MDYIEGRKPIDKIGKFIVNKYLPSKIVSNNEHFTHGCSNLPNPFTDQPYNGRSYGLFGVLAGVRDGLVKPIDLPRNIPNDVTEEIRVELESWESDAHSASHYYLNELLDSDYRKMSKEELRDMGIDPYFFHGMLDKCLKIVDNPKNLRFIFWFDN